MSNGSVKTKVKTSNPIQSVLSLTWKKFSLTISSSRTKNLNLISNYLYLLCSPSIFTPDSCIIAMHLLLAVYSLKFKIFLSIH